MGSHLSEQTLAKEIGISRTPVREALSRLGTEGLVEHVPDCGTFVKKFSRQDIWEMLELRELLEGYAAARAAVRLGPEQLDELQILCDRMLQLCRTLQKEKRSVFTPEEEGRFVSADASFHLIMLRSSGNSRVERLVDDYGLINNLCRRFVPVPESIQYKISCWTWRSHARILRALKKHDGEEAGRLMSYHIRRSEIMTLRYFDEEEETASMRMARHAAFGGEVSA